MTKKLINILAWLLVAGTLFFITRPIESANAKEPLITKTNDQIIEDIDLGDYETEVEVDATMSISASVVPSNATDTIIHYSSSDPSVAIITSQGEIKGKQLLPFRRVRLLRL